MSNMRYCQGAVCHPGQFGYVRTDPTRPGPINQAGVIDVHPGDRVVWTNVDAFCDFEDGRPFECPGHDVVFEDGKVRSPLLASQHRVDITKPGPKPAKFAWVVPTKTRPGKLIRYYCDAPDRGDGHAEGGMTGVLRVV